jgi:hypothetical protein
VSFVFLGSTEQPSPLLPPPSASTAMILWPTAPAVPLSLTLFVTGWMGKTISSRVLYGGLRHRAALLGNRLHHPADGHRPASGSVLSSRGQWATSGQAAPTLYIASIPLPSCTTIAHVLFVQWL